MSYPGGILNRHRIQLTCAKLIKTPENHRPAEFFPALLPHFKPFHPVPSRFIPYHLIPYYTSTVNVAESVLAGFAALPPFRSSARLEAIFASNILLDRALLGSSLASFSIVPVPGHDRGELVKDLWLLTKTTRLVQECTRK